MQPDPAEALDATLGCRGTKALAATVAYALSPFDLIRNVIPVVGHLDDLIIVPAAILVTVRMIPTEVMADLGRQAEIRLGGQRPRSVIEAVVIATLWVLGAAWIGAVLLAG